MVAIQPANSWLLGMVAERKTKRTLWGRRMMLSWRWRREGGRAGRKGEGLSLHSAGGRGGEAVG